MVQLNGTARGGRLISAGMSDLPCDTCGSTAVLTVATTLEDSPVSVGICTDCEARTWIRGGMRVGRKRDPE
jgi:hypothetical protein